MSLSRRDVVLGAAVALVGAAARAGETHRVNIPADRTAFVPAELTVKAGDTVRWRNRSIVEHSVVCDPAKAKDPKNGAHPAGTPPFDSGVFANDATFEHTFETPGTYRYFCREHEGMGMVGMVTVTA